MKYSSIIFLLFCAEALGAPVPGGLFVWDIPEEAKEIRYKNKPILVIQNKAIIGIPISETPGQQTIAYKLNGNPRKETFEILDKKYSEQHITIKNKALVTPPPKELTRIQNESRAQKSLYESYSPPVKLGSGFIAPLKGTITSLFGHRRFFNGQPRSPHSGLDIAAKTGTPIIAPALGNIVLAEELYFNGNTVFIDHGQGLITMYCHMSEILVSNGTQVQQGTRIGLVGATGRATGPHLHWSVSLNGYRVNPNTLVQTINTIVDADGVSYAE